MIRSRVAWLVALFWLILPAAGLAGSGTTGGSLSGQLLVASPKMSDPRFARTVIYIVSHDDEGAMGLVVNRTFGRGSLKALLQGFGIQPVKADRTVALHYGGPVEQARGFVLHSADYTGVSTRQVADDVAISTGVDILQAVAGGSGPRRSLFLLGYAGWAAGQLEDELARNDWMLAPADDGLIFSDDPDPDGVWKRVMNHAGTPL